MKHIKIPILGWDQEDDDHIDVTDSEGSYLFHAERAIAIDIVQAVNEYDALIALAKCAEEMQTKPILFNGEMVRAILDGRKTQTRRVIKPQPKAIITTRGFWQSDDDGSWAWCYQTPVQDGNLTWNDCRLLGNGKCPYGEVGDHLWVREMWATDYLHDGIKPSKLTPRDSDIYYRADGDIDTSTNIMIHRWRPSIHMPRWASRITLEVVSVRVEQVQDINHEDVLAEGIARMNIPPEMTLDEYKSAGGSVYQWEHNGARHTLYGERATFAQLWDKLNAKRGYSWDSNPWVWVVEFKQKETS